MTRRWLIAIALALGTLVSHVHASGARLASSSSGKQLGTGLSITQSVAGIASLTSTVAATVGVVDFSPSAGLRQQLMGGSIPNASAIASLPIQNFGDGVSTKEQIRVIARDFMLPRAKGLIASLESWMGSNGVTGGTFVYQQEVQPKGVSRRMRLVWQIIIADSGRALYGDPKVIDGDPTVVYMLYTSKAVATGLPASWAWPDAGKLQWQLRRLDGTPVTSMTTIDTAGAFDEPATDGDPDWGVKCLTDFTVDATCPKTFTSAKSLVEQTSSMGAIVDYVRMVQPVYDEVPDPAAPSETAYVPRMSLSYDQREVSYTACAVGTYRNAGRYGFTLSTIVDRYMVAEGGSKPLLANRFTGTSISPTQTFDRSVPVTLKSSALQPLVISPFDQSSSLVSYLTLPGVTYIAPLTVPSVPPTAVEITWTNQVLSSSVVPVYLQQTLSATVRLFGVGSDGAFSPAKLSQVSFKVSKCDLDEAKFVSIGTNPVYMTYATLNGVIVTSGMDVKKHLREGANSLQLAAYTSHQTLSMLVDPKSTFSITFKRLID